MKHKNPLYKIEEHTYNNETWFHLLKWSNNTFIVDPGYALVKRYTSLEDACCALLELIQGGEV